MGKMLPHAKVSMEFIDGGSLTDVIAFAKPKLTEPDIAYILYESLQGYWVIDHRDYPPS